MIDEVTIANMALSHIGTKTNIESLSENSAEAKQINLWYDIALDQSLAANDWSFARKKKTLATHADAADNEWAYRYQYPADCLAARFIQSPYGKARPPVPFEVELDSTGVAKSVLTDVENAVLVYTFRQTTPALFSPFFVIMFSYLLGHYASYKLSGKKEISDKLLNIYTNLALNAPTFDYNEGIHREPPQPEHIRMRA